MTMTRHHYGIRTRLAEGDTMRQRTAGSVRFDPYWKVQWWDKTSLTWRDIQKAHHTEGDATDAGRIEAARRETDTRLMRITEDGREPTHTFTYQGSISDDPTYCTIHDLFHCPYAHDPRRIP